MKRYLSFILGGLMTLAVVGYFVASADTTLHRQVENDSYKEYRFFATSTTQTFFATTTTATSTNILPWFTTDGVRDNGQFVIAGAKEVLVFFGRGDTTGQGNTGTTTFKIQTSPDGTDWYDYPRLQAATTTLASADARFSTVSTAGIAAATTTDVFKLTDLGWYSIRCIVVETTDGEHSCSASATWE